MTKRKTNTKAENLKEQTLPEPFQPPTQKKASKPAGDKKKFYVSTKQELLVEMLNKKTGANIDTIVKATGWLPHTSRAMISNLRKAGHNVETSPGKDGKAIYRITGLAKKATPRSRAKS